MLGDLANDHYNHMIDRKQYLLKRRELLEQVDKFYNGKDHSAAVIDDNTTQPKKSHTTAFQIPDRVKNMGGSDFDDGKF